MWYSNVSYYVFLSGKPDPRQCLDILGFKHWCKYQQTPIESTSTCGSHCMSVHENNEPTRQRSSHTYKKHTRARKHKSTNKNRHSCTHMPTPLIVYLVIMKASHTLLPKFETEVWSHNMRKERRMMTLQGFTDQMRSSALLCVKSLKSVWKKALMLHLQYLIYSIYLK